MAIPDSSKFEIRFISPEDRISQVSSVLNRLIKDNLILGESVHVTKVEETPSENECLDLFNPELVEYVKDRVSSGLIPIITEELFTDFAVKNGLSDKILCSRLFGAFRWDNIHKNDYSERQNFRYLYEVSGPKDVALRADKLTQLNCNLEDGRFKIGRIGPKLKILLSEVERHIYNKNQMEPNES